MEKVYIQTDNLSEVCAKAAQCVIALGYFDGIHLGHQSVIKEAKKVANHFKLPLALMSFTPHPINILSKGKQRVPNLSLPSEKEKMLQKLGVDIYYLVNFTTEFAALSPKQFVQKYLVNLKVKHAVAGFDFTYGAKGIGNILEIPELSEGKISVSEVQCMKYMGEKISSTAIRQRLLSTKVHEIPYFLGEYYATTVTFIENKLILEEEKMLPKPGIYLVEIMQKSSSLKVLLELRSNGELKLINKLNMHLSGLATVQWLHHLNQNNAS